MYDNNRDYGGSSESVLMACDKECGYKKNRNFNVKTWWWNSRAKYEAQRKKEAYNEMKRNLTEETKNEYRKFKFAATKAVARDVKDDMKRIIFGLNSNNGFRHVCIA